VLKIVRVAACRSTGRKGYAFPGVLSSFSFLRLSLRKIRRGGVTESHRLSARCGGIAARYVSLPEVGMRLGAWGSQHFQALDVETSTTVAIEITTPFGAARFLNG
jgi:hypothetical protein